MIKLYSTGCPLCMVLEEKLIKKNISFELISDKKTILAAGIELVPVIELEDETRLNYKESLKWIGGM